MEKISARKADLNVRHLFIVPERYTLLAEKRLYELCEGSFDVEVLSPSRLFYKMKISTPLISREGAIMLLRGMLPNIKLECFGKAASFRGFCEKLYDAINDLAAFGVLPEDMPSYPPKLNDLKTVYAQYLSAIEGRFVDSMGKLKLIAKYAETSEYLSNVHVYIANFDYVDAATRQVFDKLKERALSYTECCVKSTGERDKKLKAEKFYGDGAPAVKEVAKRLRFMAYRGVRYEDMAVIMGNADPARVKRIFTEFGIPHFIAESKRLIDHPLSSFIIRLFDCAKSFKREAVIELSKNMYMNISKRDADLFENHIYKNLINYKDFLLPFNECEDTRIKLVSIVNKAAQKMKNVSDAASLRTLITELFADMGAEKLTTEAFGSSVTDKMTALIDLMEQVGIKGNFDFVFSVFTEGLKATKLNELPYEGGVIVGDPGLFRGGRYEFVAVLGFDDGFLPQIYDDSSLIGDEEKAYFTMERVEEINLRYEAELYACLFSASHVFATYVEPSGMMNELFQSAKDVSLYENDGLEARTLNAGCFKHAKELLIMLGSGIKAGTERDREFMAALFEATGRDDKLFLQQRVEQIDDGEKLFFPNGSTSVSRLQSYFACPFLNFVTYGLQLQRRDKGEVTPLDEGDLMHRIAELVIRNGGDISKQVDKAVDTLKSGIGKLALPSNAQRLNELKAEAKEALGILSSHLKKGKFVSMGQEIPFSATIGGMKISGKIDYADCFGDYIRIIDYKTGSAAWDLSDIYYGKKIQLPVYMAVETSKGKKKAAMFLYPLHAQWLSDRFSHRFTGFILEGEEIASAIDPTYKTEESEVYRLTTPSGKAVADKTVLSSEEFDCVVDYAIRVCVRAVEEIKSGFIAPSADPKTCNYCEFGCLCAAKRIREFLPVKKSSFKELK